MPWEERNVVPSSAPTPTAKTPPDLAAFLRLPVATPSSCPSAPGSTAGRRSPWVGHVDISVFVDDHASHQAFASLGVSLRALPHVTRVYAETKNEAWQEFRRLYTCSDQVPRSSLPASYRLVLGSISLPQRDDLVRRIYRMPAVKSVSCDPSSPCVDVQPKH
jgi:hypothetical protein